MLKVVCFKWQNERKGYSLPSMSVLGQYTAKHVNKLYHEVTQHLSIPHEFICITDDPTGVECKTIPLWNKCKALGGCYNRLYIFSEDMRELIGERFVCIDLDVAVTGSLDELFSRQEDFIINQYHGNGHDFLEQRYNGALIMMSAGCRSQVWEQFEQDDSPQIMQQEFDARRRIGSDQAWISYVLGKGEAVFSESDGVFEFRKVQEDNRRDTRLVFFAGRRDPSLMTSGWVRQYWNRPIPELFVDRQKAAKKLGYVPNVTNPKSFNEHILWSKYHNRNPFIPLTTDKVRVRNYVKSILGEEVLIPLIWSGDSPRIPFDILPQDVIIKPTHMSGKILAITGGRFDRKGIAKEVGQWLQTQYGRDKLEWGYSQIYPGVMVEQHLGPDLADYKFHIINGRCRWISVYTDRFTPYFGMTNYDLNWNLLPFTMMYKKGRAVSKPSRLEDMVRMAETLAVPFRYVRVDLYLVKNTIYFGEITHYPSSGHGKFTPVEFDHACGGYFDER